MRTEDRMGAPVPTATGGGPARPAPLPLLPTLESAWPGLCALVAVLCLWLWAGAIGDVTVGAAVALAPEPGEQQPQDHEVDEVGEGLG